MSQPLEVSRHTEEMRGDGGDGGKGGRERRVSRCISLLTRSVSLISFVSAAPTPCRSPWLSSRMSGWNAFMSNSFICNQRLSYDMGSRLTNLISFSCLCRR